jgi:poly-gamma-glutamate synthesis protein (capsule biosynthesis protein)
LRPDAVLRDVEAARASAAVDVLVVSIHADLEFVDWPAPHRLALSRRIIEAGADLVLSHHPHVPQGLERHGRGLIAYSLGNFVFPVLGNGYMQQGSVYTGRSFILLVELGRQGYVSHEIVPCRISELFRPEPMSAGAEREAFLAHIQTISAGLADEAALARHWSETAWRYLGINIGWLASRAHQKDLSQWAAKFFCRLLYDENRPWVRQVLAELQAKIPPRPS